MLLTFQFKVLPSSLFTVSAGREVAVHSMPWKAPRQFEWLYKKQRGIGEQLQEVNFQKSMCLSGLLTLHHGTKQTLMPYGIFHALALWLCHWWFTMEVCWVVPCSQIHELVQAKHSLHAKLRNMEDVSAAIVAENESLRSSLQALGQAPQPTQANTWQGRCWLK